MSLQAHGVRSVKLNEAQRSNGGPGIGGSAVKEERARPELSDDAAESRWEPSADMNSSITLDKRRPLSRVLTPSSQVMAVDPAEPGIQSSFVPPDVSIPPASDFDVDQDAAKADLADQIHEWLFHLFMKTPLGLYCDLFQTVLSFVACGVYIASTYTNPEMDELPPTWLLAADITFAACFTLDYLLHLYLARNNRCAYMTSWQSLIDLVAILPIISLIVPSPQLGFLRLMRGIRVLSILRANRLFAGEVDPSTALQRQLIMMAFTLLAFVFIAAGIIYSVDDLYDGSAFSNNNGGDKMTFFDAIYFLLITFTTVGYGDIFPILFVSKLITICLIVLVLVILPRETAKISLILEKTSPYDAAYVASANSEHLLICGRASAHKILRFLTEFYHEDHGEQTAHVIILMADEPSFDVETLILRDPSFDERVQYVKGNPINDNDLKRVSAAQAVACFVLADPMAESRQTSDIDAILSAKAIALHSSKVRVFIQLMLPTSKQHVRWAYWHQCISMNEVKLCLLAGAARCPGFGTLMCNLIISTGELDVEQEWQNDYVHGFGQELYSFPFSKVFVGWTFAEVCAEMYSGHNICVFGITLPDGTICLAPAGHIIVGDEEAILLAGSAEEGQPISDPEYNLRSGLRPVSDHVLPTGEEFERTEAFNVSQTDTGYRITSYEEVSLQGHIILCGNINGLYGFVRPLRATTMQPVVILHPEEPFYEVDWLDLVALPNVFFCPGNPMQIEDLLHAGAAEADCIVIICDDSGYFVSTTNRSIDSFAIFVTNVMSEYFPDCRVVVEMVDEVSMTQLSHAPDNSEPYALWPQYTSGQVYMSNMLDRLIAQCFYKENILNVLSALVGNATSTEQNGVLYVPVPEAYEDRKWVVVFYDLCLNRSCVPIALYRSRAAYCYDDEEEDAKQSAEEQAEDLLPFLYTNPSPDTVLARGDCIIAIGKQSSNDERLAWKSFPNK